MTAIPLRERTLATLPEVVRRPTYDRAAAVSGVVHLGVGGFHRSHQAVYFDRLLARGHADWGITGVGVLAVDRALHAALRGPRTGSTRSCSRPGTGRSSRPWSVRCWTSFSWTTTRRRSWR